MNDQRLLKEYAEHGSQQAFDELSRRYLRLVYSTCRRELANSELAEDAAQAVFILLARKARSLTRTSNLGGWLFQASILTSRNARRAEARRVAREQAVAKEAVGKMWTQGHNDDTVGHSLNEALGSLKPADREAVLLRYMTGCTLSETGAALGLTEDGAKKRIERALSKLHRFLTGHGVMLGAGGVVLLLEKQSEAAPSHLINAVLHIGMAGGTAGTAAVSASAITIAQGALRNMLISKAVAIGTVALFVSGGIVVGAKLNAAMKPFASWPAAVPPSAVIPPANGKPAPAIIRTAVEAVTAGDVGKILPSMTPDLAALFTKEETQSLHKQDSALGSLVRVDVTSEQTTAGSVDYHFKSYYAAGTDDGEMDVNPQGKIDLLSFTPDVILAPTTPFAPLVTATVNAVVAGDASTLASLSEPSMASILSGDSLTSVQSQLNQLGSVTGVTVDQVLGGRQMVSCAFTVKMTKGAIQGRLAEDSVGKIVALEMHPAGHS